jgi:hypothetical protein
VTDFVDPVTGMSRGNSPLFFVDNARSEAPLARLKVPMPQMNTAINKVVVQLFDSFNQISARHSDMYTLDSKDYSSLLRSGIVTIGMSRLRVVENDADIARALKANLSQSVLVEGLDLASATHAALVITAGDNAINTVTSPSIEQAQAMLNTLLGGHIGNKKVTLYLGMYRQSREQVDIMSIVGGLKFPVNRLL